MIYDSDSAFWRGHYLVFDLAQLAIKLPGWPVGLERPYASDLDNSRLLRAISGAFSGLGATWNPERAVEIITDAAEIEKEHHQSAIDDLKLNPATGMAEDIAA